MRTPMHASLKIAGLTAGLYYVVDTGSRDRKCAAANGGVHVGARTSADVDAVASLCPPLSRVHRRDMAEPSNAGNGTSRAQLA